MANLVLVLLFVHQAYAGWGFDGGFGRKTARLAPRVERKDLELAEFEIRDVEDEDEEDADDDERGCDAPSLCLGPPPCVMESAEPLDSLLIPWCMRLQGPDCGMWAAAEALESLPVPWCLRLQGPEWS